MECYSDYANRLPRGRTYVRNGSVVDLKLNAGSVRAKVMGSELYDVSVSIAELPKTRWKAVCADCSSSVASLVELLQGKFSKAVMKRVCAPGTGLFPTPKELKFECSCPDWAGMCKHVAAVLYGVGARLDQQPELLFLLRQLNAQDLVLQAGAAKPKDAAGTKSKKILEDADLADVFGLEMVNSKAGKPKAAAVKKPAPKGKAVIAPVAKKTVAKKASKKPMTKATQKAHAKK
ncbi:MAG: SWIM zinc finger family protein [Burkholderiales bacterium]